MHACCCHLYLINTPKNWQSYLIFKLFSIFFKSTCEIKIWLHTIIVEFI
uniref:Uncharacterized protein n=1 Tax=Manihot esculenta TaxID=3983 RepID=A0A2C9WNC8_MANES